MTTNQINYFAAKENQRHNLAMEQETARHNVKTENISHETNIINSSHFNRMDDESVRHNVATERESARHNVATEQVAYGTLEESARHNLATEDVARGNLRLGFANLQLGYDKLSEEGRHNRAAEGISYQSVLETHRHNFASEQLISGQLEEDVRHNKEVESENVRVNNTVVRQNLAKTNLTEAQTSGVNLDNVYLQKTMDNRVSISHNEAVRSKNEAEIAAQENQSWFINTPIRNMGSYFGTGGRYYESSMKYGN